MKFQAKCKNCNWLSAVQTTHYTAKLLDQISKHVSEQAGNHQISEPKHDIQLTLQYGANIYTTTVIALENQR